MVHEVVIAAFSSAYTQEVLSLSRRLEEDALPCSFWSLDEQSVAQFLQHEHRQAVVALIGGQVVGIGALRQGEQYQRHLAEISVAICPQHRRRGVARAVIASLEELAGKRGVEILKGLVQAENLASRRLIESLRYVHRATLYAEFKSEKFGEIDDCVYYKRLVSP